MKRALLLGALVSMGWLGLVSTSNAQVFIRAPFVRVGVGDGVYVRAPFVNLYVPPSGPVYGPRVVYVPSQQFMPPPSEALPAPIPPQEKPAFKPPLPKPVDGGEAVTFEAFAKNFQPKAGSYEVTIMNPVTNQPNAVRFTLPEGTPRRTVVTRDSIEFVYSFRSRVLIDFDRDGAHVIAR